MQRLCELFREKDEARHVAVSAMPGAGKPALAREYVSKHRNEYDQVLWLAADHIQLNNSYLDIGERLGPKVEAELNAETENDKHVAIIREGLSMRGAKRLLVYDNVDDREQLRQYLPTGPSHVLITTRWKEVENTVLDEADGLRVLQGNLQEVFQGAEHDALIALGEHLGWVAQALKIASGLFAQHIHRPSTLLHELLKQAADNISSPSEEGGMCPTPDLGYLFGESFKALGAEGGAGAVKLMLVAGWLAPSMPIRRGLLLKAGIAMLWEEEDENRDVADPAFQALYGSGRDLTPDKHKVACDYLVAIEKLGLAEVETARGDLRFHPLVLAYARKQSGSSGDNRQGRGAAQTAVRLLAWMGDVEQDSEQYRAVCASVLSSSGAGAAEGFAPKLLEVFVARVLRKLMDRDLEHHEVGGWPQLLERCLENAGAGGSDRCVAQVKAALGDVALAEGKNAEAVQIGRAAVAEFGEHYGPDHLETLRICSQLACALDKQGHHSEAQALHLRALEGRESLLGPAHLDTLASVKNLARLLFHQGRHSEVEALLRRTLEGLESLLGPEHPETLCYVNNLAAVLYKQDLFYEAEALLRRALKGEESALGPSHPTTLETVQNLAAVLCEQGHFYEAEALQRRALEGWEYLLGPPHPKTLGCVEDLAHVLHQLRSDVEVEKLLRRVVKELESALGPEHPSTLDTVNSLAMALSWRGLHAEAVDLLRRVLKGRESLLGPAHPSTLGSVNNLAAALIVLGQLAEAEGLARRTLEGRESLLGLAHPSTLDAVGILALILFKQGRYAAAEELHRRAVEGQESALGPEHPEMLASLHSLAQDLSEQGHYAEAEELHRRALEGRESLLGPAHPDTLESVNSLGVFLFKRGRIGEARELLLRLPKS